MIISLNFVKKIFLIFAIFIFFAACGSRFFINSSNSEIQKIEREDHQFCVSLGLDFDEDALKTEIYWRCKLALAKSRIKSDDITPEAIRLNIAIQKLIADITTNYNNSYEKWGDSRNSLFDNNDHQTCITQGHSFDSLEQIAVEDYFICRKRLLNDQQIIPPYHKTEYFKRSQDSYNIGFAINQKTDRDIANFEAIKAKYPKCVKLDFKGEDFKICKSDYDQQRQCFKKITNLKFKRELQEKTACQKKAYVRFPDSMLKKDDKKMEEIASANRRADLSNSSNFFSIGLNEEQIAKFKGEDTTTATKDVPEKEAFPKKDIDKKIADTKNALEKDDEQKIAENIIEDFDSKNHLYDKIDLTKLRQRFIFSCQKALDPSLTEYGIKLQKNCDAIVEKWEE